MMRYEGTADVRASHRSFKHGELLLDPYDVWIAGFSLNDGNLPTITAGANPGDTFFLTANAITTALQTGDVTIAASNNIEVQVPVASNTYHANTLTMTAGNVITIFNGCDLSTRGKLNLAANAGIDIRSNIHSDGTTVLNADNDNDGAGILTLAESKTVSTRHSLLTIRAADIHVLGTVTSGSGATVFVPSAGRTIGLGNTAKDVHITDDELGSFVAAGGLTLGDMSSGTITVVGITDSSSDNVGTLSLVATKATAEVNFVTSPSSFQKGLQVQANQGIQVTSSVTSKFMPTILNCGTATLTVSALQTLSSTGQLLLVTADNIDLAGDLNAGTVNIACTTLGRVVGVGDAAKLAALTPAAQIVLDQSELQRTTATGLFIGGGVCGDQSVIGVTNATSGAVTGIVTLLASGQSSTITFTQDPSTFHALAVQADRGIGVQVDLTTTQASMNFDGDVDNAPDASNDVVFAADRTIKAASMLTLQSSSGEIKAAGKLSLLAGAGIAIFESLGSTSTGSKFVINADYDSAGDGTLTLAGSKTIRSNNGQMELTAWDLDLAGSMDVGSRDIKLYGAGTNQSIGLGLASQNMHLQNEELQRITTEGFTLGYAGTISVNSVTAEASQYISSPIMTLIASYDNSTVNFVGSASTFFAMNALADDGVVVQTLITTCMGSLLLDADLDNSSTGDAGNNIAIAALRTIQAKEVLTLMSDSGSIHMAGDLTLAAGKGLILHTSLQGAVSGGSTLVLDSDYELPIADGTLTLCASKVVDSNNNAIQITAWDIDFQQALPNPGAINAGMSTIAIHGSKTEQTIGIGDVVQDMHISDAELGRLTSSAGVTIGGTSNGQMVVQGVTDGNSDSLSTLTLKATNQFKTVVFDFAASSFNKGIVVQAMGGVAVSESVTTKNTPTVLNAGTGTLSVFNGRTLSTTGQALQITSNDINFSSTALVNSGTAPINIRSYSPDIKISLGSTVKDMNIQDLELNTMQCSALTIGGPNSGDIHVNQLLTSSTETQGTITLIATKAAKKVQFDQGGAAFNKGIVVQAAGGVVFLGNVVTADHPIVVSAGLGTLTVATGKSVLTTNRMLSLTADDINLCALDGSGVDLDSCGGFDTGTAAATLECTTAGRSVNIGAAPASGMHIAGFELNQFKGAGVTIGNAQCGSQTVSGVTAQNSQNIAGILTDPQPNPDSPPTLTLN